MAAPRAAVVRVSSCRWSFCLTLMALRLFGHPSGHREGAARKVAEVSFLVDSATAMRWPCRPW